MQQAHQISIFGLINHQLMIDEKHDLNGSLKIGRSSECGLFYPQFQLLSRCHCQIVRLSPRDTFHREYAVIDGCGNKRSRNGIKINGVKIDARSLEPGDEIVLVDGQISDRAEYLKFIYFIESDNQDRNSTAY